MSMTFDEQLRALDREFPPVQATPPAPEIEAPMPRHEMLRCIAAYNSQEDLDISFLDKPIAPASHFDYPPETEQFYRKLVQPGELTVVAAPTGGMKTLLQNNIAACSVMGRFRVLFLHLQMTKSRMWDRFVSILTKLPAHIIAARSDHELITAADNAARTYLDAMLKICDVPTSYNVERLSHLTKTLVTKYAPQVLIVDGLDSMTTEKFSPDELKAIYTHLATLAARHGIATVASSQTTATACGREVLSIDQLAFAIGKGHAPGTVVMLGAREDGKVVTASVTKDRHANAEDQVVRLVLRDNLRLEVLEVAGHEIVPTMNATYGDAVRIGCQSGDFPGDLPANHEAEVPNDDDLLQATQPTATGDVMRLYHGDKGFVGIDRGFFGADMYRTRQSKDIARMLSLFEMANIRPGDKQAPGNNIVIPVKRGEVLTSIAILARHWDTTPKVVRGFLERAVKQRLIVDEVVYNDGHREKPAYERGGKEIGRPKGRSRMQVGRVITLCHYHSKESSENADGDTGGTPKGRH